MNITYMERDEYALKKYIQACFLYFFDSPIFEVCSIQMYMYMYTVYTCTLYMSYTCTCIYNVILDTFYTQERSPLAVIGAHLPISLHDYIIHVKHELHCQQNSLGTCMVGKFI